MPRLASLKVCLPEVRLASLKVCLPEVSPEKAGPEEVGTAEVGGVKDWPPFEVRPAEVGTQARHNSLIETLESFRDTVSWYVRGNSSDARMFN
jgi:hypothetical protein